MTHFLPKKFFRKKNEKGYILLLTLLVISILLAVSMGIYGISAREIILSSFLRDSTKAFAAADRGVECALYWDRSIPQNGMPYSIFATSSAYTAPSNLSSAVCNDGTSNKQLSNSAVTGWAVTTTATNGVTTFSLAFSDGTCADVSVTKTGTDITSMVGDGYNTCNVGMSRRTQRELLVTTNF